MEILKLNLQQPEPQPPDAEEIRFQIALLAALSATVISFLARFLFDAPLLPEILAHAIFAILPINLIAFVVAFLGPFAKHLAFLGCVVLYLGALTAAAFYLPRLSPIQRLQTGTLTHRMTFFAAFLFAIWLLTMLVILPLLGCGFFGSFLRQGAVFTSLSLLLVFAIYTLAILLFQQWFKTKPEV